MHYLNLFRVSPTGVSVFTDPDKMPWSVQFYRNELQYIGGLGVIVIASALLPMMRIGGIHLYFADMPGPTRKAATSIIFRHVNVIRSTYF